MLETVMANLSPRSTPIRSHSRLGSVSCRAEVIVAT